MKLFRKAKAAEPVIDVDAVEEVFDFAASQRALEAASAKFRCDAHDETMVPMGAGR